MSKQPAIDWTELLTDQERALVLKEIAQLATACEKSNDFEPLGEALKAYELEAYYSSAFKQQNPKRNLSEAEAMQLALEAQRAARDSQ